MTTDGGGQRRLTRQEAVEQLETVEQRNQQLQRRVQEQSVALDQSVPLKRVVAVGLPAVVGVLVGVSAAPNDPVGGVVVGGLGGVGVGVAVDQVVLPRIGGGQ